MRAGWLNRIGMGMLALALAALVGCGSGVGGKISSTLRGENRGDDRPVPYPTDRPTQQIANTDSDMPYTATEPSGDPTLDAINAGLTAPANGAEPRFVGQPVASDGDRPARFVSTMNLYGEMPGSPEGLPDGQLANLRQVSFAHDGADFDAAVSPDGQWLVYASTQHRPTADIYMKRIDGQTITQLTSDPANDTMPAISPDGKTLAFCSNRSGSWNIYLKPIDGGQAVQLTDSPSHELHPSWSPDSTQIIFSALGEQSGQWEMVLIDVDRPASRKFIGFGLFPEFSPADDKIVYQQARHRGTRWFSVWTMDIENGEGKRPTQIAASTNAAAITPTWSPDGKRLAFATVLNPRSNDPNRRPRSAELWVINIDGTGRVKLTGDRFVNLQPTWGKDGWVYFVTNRTGTDNIWAARPTRTSISTGEGDAPDAEAAVPIPQ